jgi:hypothetical protein
VTAASTSNYHVPYYTVVTLKTDDGSTLTGSWVSEDTAWFNLGTYRQLTSKNYAYTITGLDGGQSYNLTWSLCVEGADENNALSVAAISNSVTTKNTIAAEAQHSLIVTPQQSSIVLEQGTEHTLTFECTTNADNVNVTAGKQGALANYDETNSGLNVSDVNLSADTKDSSKKTVTATVTVPADAKAGVYRLRFSMDDGSKNDDVYYTFIVE